MNFTAFWTALQTLEKSIAVTSPSAKQVKAAYWGGPSQAFAPPDFPCVINSLSESERVLGFGSRNQNLRINVQMLVSDATIDDPAASMLATAMWFATLDKFDANQTLDGTVALSVLKGQDPTVPVILQWAGQTYIGFSAVLDVQDVEDFTFG